MSYRKRRLVRRGDSQSEAWNASGSRTAQAGQRLTRQQRFPSSSSAETAPASESGGRQSSQHVHDGSAQNRGGAVPRTWGAVGGARPT